MSDHVLVAVDGPHAQITLDAPERLNAVDAAMLDALADAVLELGPGPGVRVISLTGSGRGFCSGASLSDLSHGNADTATLTAAGRAIRALVGCPVPVVALVNGVAAGVGCSLALATDYVLATESASFMLAFTRIGLMPDGAATALVAASVGRARAMRMALTAERVPAGTAYEWGLIAEVCPDAEFAVRGAAVVQTLAAGATAAFGATTRAINTATLPDLDGALAREEDGQTRLLTTDDFREGAAAFGERRPARFLGR